MKRWWVVAGLLAAPAAGTPTAAGVTAEVVVDATALDGTLAVRMRWRGLPDGEITLHPLGGSAFTYTDVKAVVDGAPAEVSERGSGWAVLAPGAVELSYRVRPGGPGRHGRQGAVASDWAVTDGRIFVVPRHGVDAARVDLAFVLPEGWVAATPFSPDGEGFAIEPQGAMSVDDQLASACFGLGAFEQLGQGETRVWAHTSWPEAHKKKLLEGTTAMGDWFRAQDHLRGPYTVVWTPRFEGGRVFGGSWGLGTCYEFPPASDRAERNWQLLGHRIAHAQNKYAPHSAAIRDRRDHWFVEGWASYAEIVSTDAVGLSSREVQLDALYSRHHRILAANPEWAFPLAREPELPDDLHEYVHYTVAPLAVAQLDTWLQLRSQTTVTAFVAWLIERHGGFRQPIALRDELEAFTGTSYADFFELYVDRAASLPPVWRRPKGPKQVVGTAGGAPITEDLIRVLGASGEVERFDALLARLGRAERRLADLERRGVALADPALLQARAGLEGRAQLDLLDAAEAFPIDRAPDPPSRGCSGPTPLPPAEWRVARSGQAAEVIEELRKLEEEAVRDGVARVAVRFDGARARETLVVGEDDDVSLMVRWVTLPARFWVDQYLDDELVRTKELVPQPKWGRTWSSFPADQRKRGQGLMRFVVRDAHGVRATHTVWQVSGSTR